MKDIISLSLFYEIICVGIFITGGWKLSALSDYLCSVFFFFFRDGIQKIRSLSTNQMMKRTLKLNKRVILNLKSVNKK